MTKRTKTVVAALCAAIAAIGLAVLLLPTAKALYQKARKLPDEHNLYRVDEFTIETLGEYNERGVAYFPKKLRRVREELLTAENRVFYAIVPDKAYFVQESGYPVYDYAKMQAAVAAGLLGWTEIELAPALTLADYYRTDSHWRQERLFGVVNALGDALGFAVDPAGFTPVTVEGYEGGYAKRAESGETEQLVYLESAATRNAVVTNIEKDAPQPVYATEALESERYYDVFLGGAAAVQIIENPNAENERELVIFRDSYGSSLAPLLLSAYCRVTLIDLRYIATDLVTDYVTFGDQDVLFLYSTWVINNATMLR